MEINEARFPITVLPRLCYNLSPLTVFFDLTGNSKHCKNNEDFLVNFLQFTNSTGEEINFTFRVNTENGVFDLEMPFSEIGFTLPSEINRVVQACKNNALLTKVHLLNSTTPFGVVTNAIENSDAILFIIGTLTPGDLASFVEELQEKRKRIVLVNLNVGSHSTKKERWIKLFKSSHSFFTDNIPTYQDILTKMKCS